jgi:hypothetical protein
MKRWFSGVGVTAIFGVSFSVWVSQSKRPADRPPLANMAIPAVLLTVSSGGLESWFLYMVC